MMSYVAANADQTKPPMIDSGNLSLRAKHPQSQQGVCADAIATIEGIDRDAVVGNARCDVRYSKQNSSCILQMISASQAKK